MSVAPVAVPFSSRNAKAELLDAPAAAFQFALLTTPAASVDDMTVPFPTKSILMAVAAAPPETTSCVVVLWVSVPLVPVIVVV